MFCDRYRSGMPLERMREARGGKKPASFPFGMLGFAKPVLLEPWKGQRMVLRCYLGMRYVTGGGLLVFPVNPDSNGNREVIRCHSFWIREGVQYDVQAVWPLLAGIRPNDPDLAPLFVDPRETLENENGEGVLGDDVPMFPSPVRPEPAGAAPAASSAGAKPSARGPVDSGADHMDVDLRGDEDDGEMGLGLLEDHCIHYYHQSIWNEFASLDSMMEVGTSSAVFKEHFG